MGLVKVAMGVEGERLAALAAKDYFFNTPVRRAYFENFTNLVPMEREGSLRASLASAGRALRRGYHLLIFPEGTRSRDGRMKPFFPTAGYLALHEGVDVLPVYLGGTHQALPPGTHFLAMKPGDLEVHIGPLVRVDDLRRRTGSLPHSEVYRVATAVLEEAVRALEARWLAAHAPEGPAAPPAATPGGGGTPRTAEPAAATQPASSAAAAPAPVVATVAVSSGASARSTAITDAPADGDLHPHRRHGPGRDRQGA
jgi:long-chain acyl-CoA synthetase